MADPLSLAASIVAFIEITDRVIRACKHCIDTIKDAPRDMQIILGEVASLRAIIDGLGAADLHNQTITPAPGLLEKTGPVEACRRCLLSLESLLPSPPLGHNMTKPRRITFAELAWPLKESKARKLLAEIALHKSTLLLALTGDMIHDIKDIRSGVQRLEYAMTDAERREVHQWLECTNPSPLHNLAIKNHEKETGIWLLRLPEWNNWVNEPEATRLLWLHGIPGAGKTVLVSFLIEEIKEHCMYSSEVGHAYYYCHYSHGQDEAAPFLRWIVSQLCRQARWVPRQLHELHSMGCDPSIPELENALEILLSKFKTFYVFIDAVDESSPRDDLLAVIATLAVDKRFHNLKILATSRPYFDIERMFMGVSTNISMSNPWVADDIRRMVHSQLHSSHRLKRFSHLLDFLENALVTGAQGMFRWAQCQLYYIARVRDESQLLLAIQNLPKDLVETYVRGLNDIPVADRPFVRRVFIWIQGHRQVPWVTSRGINAHVLLSAVSYDLGLQTGAYSIDDLKELCGCLIDVSVDPVSKEGRNPDDEFSPSSCRSTVDEGQDSPLHGDANLSVSLAHYTVSEFIESTLILETNAAYFSLPPTTTLFAFIESVLRQALHSDPMALATDWVIDREAYCLTLACALNRITDLSGRPNIQDLLIQYYNCNNPHYRRIGPIQKRLIERNDYTSPFYLLRKLPVRTLHLGTMKKAPDCLATVLNIIRAVSAGGHDVDGLIARCLTVYAVENKQQLFETQLRATFLIPKSEFKQGVSSIVAREIDLQGTVDDIVKQAAWEHYGYFNALGRV